MGNAAAYDVFLSYNRSDGGAAAELNGWLRASGLRTFFDSSELHPGLPWIRALEDAHERIMSIATRSRCRSRSKSLTGGTTYREIMSHTSGSQSSRA